MNRPVDLTNCDREPIHIPGSIQPFGFLLGLQSDFTIRMASENVADYLGRDYADVFQRPVEDVLSKAAVDAIRARVDYLAGPDASERIFGVPLQDGGKPFDIAIHFSGVYLIIEAEPSVIEHDTNSGEMVRLMVSRIRKTKGVTELAQEAARQLKVLNGFDRVMVYRFHSGWIGRGDRRGRSVRTGAVPRAALSGLRYSGAGTHALHPQLAAHHRRYQRQAGAAGLDRDPQRGAARPLDLDAAVGVADPHRISAEHGRRRVDVGVDPARRQIVGPVRLPSLFAAAHLVRAAHRRRTVRPDVFLDPGNPRARGDDGL